MKYKHFTENEREFIRENYKKMGNVALGKSLDRSFDSIKHQISRVMKLRRTPGQVKALQRVPNAGQFKNGSKPYNTLHDGMITTRHYKKDGRSYRFIRISEDVWEPLSRHTWEQKHGKLKKGDMISFKDGNSLNDQDVNNLELITRKENLARNNHMKSMKYVPAVRVHPVSPSQKLKKVERRLKVITRKKCISNLMKKKESLLEEKKEEKAVEAALRRQIRRKIAASKKMDVVSHPKPRSIPKDSGRTDGKVKVVINDRTTIYVDPSKDIEKIKRMYEQVVNF